MECQYEEGLSDSGIDAIVERIFRWNPSADRCDVMEALSICNTLVEIGGSWKHVRIHPQRFFAKTRQDVEKMATVLHRLVTLGIVEEHCEKYRCLTFAL